MIVPDGWEAMSDDELVEHLVDAKGCTREDAEATVEVLRDPDPDLPPV